MSYTSRHRYKSRREKGEIILKRIKMTLFVIAVTILVIVILNRVWLWDVIRTSFYD